MIIGLTFKNLLDIINLFVSTAHLKVANMENNSNIPLTPKEALEAKPKPSISLEPTVKIINKFLSLYNGSLLQILQKDVVSELLSTGLYKDEKYLVENKLLDIEEIFRKFGWKVTYYKANYREEFFQPYWIFEAE